MSDTDEKLDNSLNSMKNQINEEKLSDDFKEMLCKKLEESEEKTSNKSKIHFPKSLIAVTACFVFVLGCGFAGEFDNLILKHFSNIDEVAKRAVEEGKVEYLNQDYVTDQGISIKADYIFEQENDLYIVLEARNEDGYKIYLDEYEIIGENGETLFNSDNYFTDRTVGNVFYSIEKNCIMYLKIINIENKYQIKCLNIKKVYFEKNSNMTFLKGNWKINIWNNLKAGTPAFCAERKELCPTVESDVNSDIGTSIVSYFETILVSCCYTNPIVLDWNTIGFIA